VGGQKISGFALFSGKRPLCIQTFAVKGSVEKKSSALWLREFESDRHSTDIYWSKSIPNLSRQMIFIPFFIYVRKKINGQ